MSTIVAFILSAIIRIIFIERELFFFYLLTWPQPISEIYIFSPYYYLLYFDCILRYSRSVVFYRLEPTVQHHSGKKQAVFVSPILIWFTIPDQYTGLNKASVTGLIHWQRRVSPGFKKASEESYWNAIVMVNTSPKGCSLLVCD